ncbi:MAG: hypothetical protein WBL35_01885 [Ornithinibacter sp.]
MASSGWVGVRCVFQSEVDGTRTFEERVTIWRASDVAVGIQLAEYEALEYAEMIDATYTGLAQATFLPTPSSAAPRSSA